MPNAQRDGPAPAPLTESTVYPARVLVTGANGFIGGAVVEALLAAGHSVVASVRSPDQLPDSPALTPVVADFRRFRSDRDWMPLLAGVTAVVNCAGILRETRAGDFELIHTEVPRALLAACHRQGVEKFVQISALGDESGGVFISSKHDFDRILLASGLPATVIRPSVVLSTRGSYGGTSLLRAMAALPGVVLLPGKGGQPLQPILLEDLAALVVRCLAPQVAAGRVLHAVGPEILTLRETLSALRAWLRLPAPVFLECPAGLVRLVVRCGERLHAGPLGRTIAAMLEQGNVAPPGESERLERATGLRPRSVRSVLRSSPSHVQDRWHARLYGVRPLLWLALVITWIMSGMAGLLAGPDQVAAVMDPMGIAAGFQRPLVFVTSALNLALGVALLLRWRVRLVLGLMIVSVCAYTLSLGLLAPGLWLELPGGLLKNLLVLCALLTYRVLEEQR